MDNLMRTNSSFLQNYIYQCCNILKIVVKKNCFDKNTKTLYPLFDSCKDEGYPIFCVG